MLLVISFWPTLAGTIQQIVVHFRGVTKIHLVRWAKKSCRFKKINKQNICTTYYGHGRKITVLIAIEPGDPALALHVLGSVERPWRWIRSIWLKGTMMNVFCDFCEMICSDTEIMGWMGQTTIAFLFGIICGLTTRRTCMRRLQSVSVCGGFRLPRLQYHPKFGPIEYSICEAISRLRLAKEADWDMDDLEQQICQIAISMWQFDAIFLHCGYQW